MTSHEVVPKLLLSNFLCELQTAGFPKSVIHLTIYAANVSVRMTGTALGSGDTAMNQTNLVPALMPFVVHNSMWSVQGLGKSRFCGSPEEGQSQLGGREGTREVMCPCWERGELKYTTEKEEHSRQKVLHVRMPGAGAIPVPTGLKGKWVGVRTPEVGRACGWVRKEGSSASQRPKCVRVCGGEGGRGYAWLCGQCLHFYQATGEQPP